MHLAKKERKEPFLQILRQMKRDSNVTQQDNHQGM